VTVLAPAEWVPRDREHRARVDALTSGHLQRRRRGEAHPVEDFLWTYYPFRPGQLARWHPGPGVTLAGADERVGWQFHTRTDAGVTLDLPAYRAARGQLVAFVTELLAATASRPPQLACFGLHEWAMVYRTDTVRHRGLPLRLGHAGTDAVVEAHQLRCTHYDAYRFFTPDAVPRNPQAPTLATRCALEQPGCLHATMDLYKWAAKLGPGVPGDLLLDAFELARDARELDMRASPYDLRALGYEPIPVETAGGRAAYVAAQRVIAGRGGALRARLLVACAALAAG